MTTIALNQIATQLAVFGLVGLLLAAIALCQGNSSKDKEKEE